MWISKLILNKRFSKDHYKKYVKSANDAYAYMMGMDEYKGTIDGAPQFLQDVYICTVFLCDALNSSIYLFFNDENDSRYKDKVSQSLRNCGLEDVADIYDLAYVNLGHLNIDFSKGLNAFKNSLSQNVQYNINFYEEELATIHGEDAQIYERLNKYLLEELEKNK
jgi:hypothetical protein